MKKTRNAERERSPDFKGPAAVVLLLLAVSWISLYSSSRGIKTGHENVLPGYVCKAKGQGFIIEKGVRDGAFGACPPEVRYVMGVKFDLAAAKEEDLKLLPGIGDKLAGVVLEAEKKGEAGPAWRDLGLTERARRSLEKWTYQKEKPPTCKGTDINTR
jgi:hypothetical protein